MVLFFILPNFLARRSICITVGQAPWCLTTYSNNGYVRKMPDLRVGIGYHLLPHQLDRSQKKLPMILRIGAGEGRSPHHLRRKNVRECLRLLPKITLPPSSVFAVLRGEVDNPWSVACAGFLSESSPRLAGIPVVWS